MKVKLVVDVGSSGEVSALENILSSYKPSVDYEVKIMNDGYVFVVLEGKNFLRVRNHLRTNTFSVWDRPFGVSPEPDVVSADEISYC
jgi:hypothetical protein